MEEKKPQFNIDYLFDAPKEEPKPIARIVRIEGSRDALKGKLETYKKRLDRLPAPHWDTIYKIAITEELVNTGEVDTIALAKTLKEKYGFFAHKDYVHACRVLEDYVETGGQNLHGSSGSSKTLDAGASMQ